MMLLFIVSLNLNCLFYVHVLFLIFVMDVLPFPGIGVLSLEMKTFFREIRVLSSGMKNRSGQ